MANELKNLLEPISLAELPILAPPAPPSTEQLQRDAGYHKALLLQSMLDSGLISLSEYNKITLLNRQTFSPYLVEIMPNITG